MTIEKDPVVDLGDLEQIIRDGSSICFSRAVFKAGITPSRIARQFGISQANVRKALASDEPRR